MSMIPINKEKIHQLPDPLRISHDLEQFDSEQKKFNYLRGIFVEVADVDEFLKYLAENEELDLTRKQLTRLKSGLEAFKVYLKEYLVNTGNRIGRFEARMKKTAEAFANPELATEDVKQIAHTREKVAKAMLIANKPRGAKGTSLKQATRRGTESKTEKVLEKEVAEKLLGILKARFENPENMKLRHPGMEWSKVQARLETSPEKLWSLNEMERTGGEPDVTDFDKKTGEYIFDDCSAESPSGRRNVVYDKEAQDLLKTNYPNETCNGNAVDLAAAMEIEIIDENEYRNRLQQKGKFDVNTWSWLQTPLDKRAAGVALRGNRFVDGVYVFGTDPNFPYGGGGFRGSLRV